MTLPGVLKICSIVALLCSTCPVAAQPSPGAGASHPGGRRRTFERPQDPAVDRKAVPQSAFFDTGLQLLGQAQGDTRRQLAVTLRCRDRTFIDVSELDVVTDQAD